MSLRDSQIAASNILAIAEAARIVAHLQSRAIAVIVLKGAALSETVYELDERAMADVDLLVPQEQHDQAHRILEAFGAPRMRMASRPIGESRHYAGAYVAEHGTYVDVHAYLAQQGRWPIDHAGLFRRSVPLEFGDITTRRLSNEDSLLYLALNQATDEYATDARTAEDVKRVIERLGVEWDVVVRRARHWRCTVPVWLTLEHARRYGRADVPPGVCEALAPSRLRRSYLKRLIDPGSVPPYRYNGHGRRTRQLLASPALTDVWWRYTWTVGRFLFLRCTDWLVSNMRREQHAMTGEYHDENS